MSHVSTITALTALPRDNTICFPPNKMHAKLPGDSKEMVAARRAFLNAGYYQLFSDRINDAAAKAIAGIKSPVILMPDAEKDITRQDWKRKLSER